MSRIFGPREVDLPATVADVEGNRVLGHVMWVDVDKGEVVRAHQPERLDGDEIATYVEKYSRIYPIYGGAFKPCLFHCYGRQG